MELHLKQNKMFIILFLYLESNIKKKVQWSIINFFLNLFKREIIATNLNWTISYSHQTYEFLLYDFLTAISCSQIAEEIADIIKVARHLWDNKSTDTRTVRCPAKRRLRLRKMLARKLSNICRTNRKKSIVHTQNCLLTFERRAGVQKTAVGTPYFGRGI